MKGAIAIFLLVLMPGVLFAQSPFQGTWRLKLDSVKAPEKSYLLANGRYECLSCVEPKTDVKVDAGEQPVTGSPYVDSWSVHVVDANTVEMTGKLNGKINAERKFTILSDGNTLTLDSTDYPEGSPQPVHQTERYTRVSKGPAGSHLLSGKWRLANVESASENQMTVTFEDTPNGLKMFDPTGDAWDAKFDGKEYPAANDPGHTMVSLKRIDSNTVEETDRRGGKIVNVVRWQVTPGGRKIKYSNHDQQAGVDWAGVAEKQ